MSTGFERRVKRLRVHLLSQQVSRDVKQALDSENFVQDTIEVHEQGTKEDNIKSLESKKVEELKDLAKEKGIEGYSKMKKEELISALAGE